MPDERLRKLERRWKETGSAQDEAAYLLERVRAGEISPLGLECIPFAVLSDVNGNLEALEAVFADMRAQGISVFSFSATQLATARTRGSVSISCGTTRPLRSRDD